jgi:hypothetical protein
VTRARDRRRAAVEAVGVVERELSAEGVHGGYQVLRIAGEAVQEPERCEVLIDLDLDVRRPAVARRGGHADPLAGKATEDELADGDGIR